MQLTFGNTLLIQSKLKQYFFQFCFISIKTYHYKQCMYVPKKNLALSTITITSKMQLYQGAWRLEIRTAVGQAFAI